MTKENKFTYDVVDVAIIDASPAEVYKAVIALYDGVDNWWMPFVSSKIPKGISSADVNAEYKVSIHGMPPTSFITKTISIEPNEMIYVKYIAGAFKGDGTWIFTPEGDKTKISFRWQVNPNILLLKIVSIFYPIHKNHSSVMRKGYRLLNSKFSSSV